jgi:hypothetical protein
MQQQVCWQLARGDPFCPVISSRYKHPFSNSSVFDPGFNKQSFHLSVYSGMSSDTNNTPLPESRPGTIRNLVNTPFKKAMFAVQILSYILIVGSPFIVGSLGRLLELSGKQTAAVIFGVFLTGEILFYGSLFFLGKEIVLLLKDKMKRWFRRKKSNPEQQSAGIREKQPS